VLRVPRDNKIHTGSLSGGDHDGIFVIVVFDAESVPAVFPQGIHNVEQSEDTGNDFSDLLINVFLAPELLSGKEMDVRYFPGRDESVDLVCATARKSCGACGS
jgi:hypothetical protein